MLTLIAAVARNGVIGHENTIPWYLPEDFKHFKKTTEGQTVIMGSRTWDSLPKKPLPNRFNIVVSSKAVPNCPFIPGIENTMFVRDLESAEFHAIQMRPDNDIFIIGGASIYQQTMVAASRLIISEVDAEPEGDTFFPKIGDEWEEVSREPREGFSIVVYHKVA